MSFRYNNELGLSEDKPFNMAILFLERLNITLRESNLYRVEGNLLGCYRSLRSVYAIIHFKIKQKGNEKEEEELNKEFKKAENFFKLPNTKDRELQNIALSNIEIILDGLEVRLSDLVFDYGLLMPPDREKRDPKQAIKEVFRN